MKPDRINSHQRSEWRFRAYDPQSLLGWWWFSVKSQRAFFLAVLPFFVCAGVGLSGGGWGWLVLAVANLVFVLSRPPRLSGRLRELLPDPPPPGQFQVEVVYERDRLVTGRDEMALTIVEGWLYAEGVRSHFAVRPEDVWRLTTGSDRKGRLVLEDKSEILLHGLDDRARILLERWHPGSRWMDGEPTLPPAHVHPVEIARWKAWLWACQAFSLVGLLAWRQSVVSLESLVPIGFFVANLFYHTRRHLKRLTALDRSAIEASPLASRNAERPSPLGSE